MVRAGRTKSIMQPGARSGAIRRTAPEQAPWGDRKRKERRDARGWLQGRAPDRAGLCDAEEDMAAGERFSDAAVLVIGGGIIGLSIAAACAASGFSPLVLAEDGGSGMGASGCAAAVLAPPLGRGAQRQIGKAAWASWHAWTDWDAWIGRVTGQGAMLHADGIVRRETLTEGGWVPGGMHMALLRDVIAAHGGQVCTTRVSALVATPQGVRVESSMGPIDSSLVLLAAGIQSGDLMPESRESLTGLPGIALHLDGIPPPRHPMCLADVTIAPCDNGNGVWVTGDWGRNETNTLLPLWEAAAALHSTAASVLGRWGERRALIGGIRPKRRGNGQLITRRAYGGGAIVMAVGHGRNGFLLAPLTALAVLRLLRPSRPPWVNEDIWEAACLMLPSPIANGSG